MPALQCGMCSLKQARIGVARSPSTAAPAHCVSGPPIWCAVLSYVLHNKLEHQREWQAVQETQALKRSETTQGIVQATDSRLQHARSFRKVPKGERKEWQLQARRTSKQVGQDVGRRARQVAPAQAERCRP